MELPCYCLATSCLLLLAACSLFLLWVSGTLFGDRRLHTVGSRRGGCFYRTCSSPWWLFCMCIGYIVCRKLSGFVAAASIVGSVCCVRLGLVVFYPNMCLLPPFSSLVAFGGYASLSTTPTPGTVCTQFRRCKCQFTGSLITLSVSVCVTYHTFSSVGVCVCAAVVYVPCE